MTATSAAGVRASVVAIALTATALACKNAPAPATVKPPPNAPEQKAQPEQPKKSRYEPPPRGRPDGRIGAGVRGGDLPFAVVPRQFGQTRNASPDLVWYCPAALPADARLTFRIKDSASGRTLTANRLDRPGSTGFQRIELAQFGVELAFGRFCSWMVTVEYLKDGEPARFAFGGEIVRIKSPEQPSAPVDDVERARRLAADGLWYDAVGVLTRCIENDATDNSCRAELANLMDDVGLAVYLQSPAAWNEAQR